MRILKAPKSRQPRKNTRLESFIKFGPPLNEAFVISALDAFAAKLIRERLLIETPPAGGSIPIINPAVWIACAQAWVDSGPIAPKPAIVI